MNKKQFKLFRDLLGISQDQMAKDMSYSSAKVISNKERGTRGVTRIDLLLLEKIWPEKWLPFKSKHRIK